MAREEKIEQNDVQPTQGKKKGSALKWIAIIGVVLMVLAAAGGGGWYYMNKAQSDKKAVSQASAIGTLWPMEPFIVNLADSNGERYLKLVIQLEVSDPLCVQELDSR
jgi:flagellar FliL protein